MKTLTCTAAALCLIALAMTGCDGASIDDSEETASKKAGGSANVVVLAALFTAGAPEDAVPLIDAKTNAKAGDRVVFEARVGGRVEAFIDNRAVFFVADLSLAACGEAGEDDNCRTPWDYCCEPRDNLTRHMATVQVVDDEGKPLKVSLKNQHGLAPLTTIVVTGIVDQIDDAGTFVVNAESIHVPGPKKVDVMTSLFTNTPPDDAVSLIDAKSNARLGDRVVFEARVGGRVESFLDNRALFFVTDASLLSCNQLSGDSCRTPWDYCCEPRDNLTKHMATVQVVDQQGMLLKRSLQNEHGLNPLKTVFITGTVDQIDDAGTFVINAESIHVKGG